MAWCYFCGKADCTSPWSRETTIERRYSPYDPPSKEPAMFTVKDTGKRQELAGGMVRNPTEGKVDYTLVLDGPMFLRWAEHLTKGAAVYAKRNWMKCASGTPEDQKRALERFKESALRHFVQWYYGETDEDHAAAAYFNLNGYEYLKAAMSPQPAASALALVPEEREAA